jgi:hypothetical protein
LIPLQSQEAIIRIGLVKQPLPQGFERCLILNPRPRFRLFSAVWWSAGTTSSEECHLAFLATWFQFILQRVPGNGTTGISRKSPRESQVDLTWPFDNGSCERDDE